MSVDRNELVTFLNKELNITQVKDVSCNGLQVEGSDTISKVGLAVDGCMQSYKAAVESDCDMLIVHHGMIWGGIKAITGITRKQIAYLLENDLNLYGVHLPLDLHGEYGNNIRLAQILGVIDPQPFGDYLGTAIGFKGELAEPASTHILVDRLDDSIGGSSQHFDLGNEVNTTVGIVSGGGASDLRDAIDDGIDCFITGEYAHWNYHAALEAGINLIYGGHYATETVGVQAVGELIEATFNIETLFIDIPTPI